MIKEIAGQAGDFFYSYVVLFSVTFIPFPIYYGVTVTLALALSPFCPEKV